jgi:hypothetical protein
MRRAAHGWLLGRPLAEREREFLQRYFGESLACAPIRVVASIGHRSWSPFGARISLVARHFCGHSARKDVRLDDPESAACFAHEALHVWQRQHGRHVTREAIPLQLGYSLGTRDPYAYRPTHDPAELLQQFIQGNVEQQGKIFEDYVYTHCTGGDTSAFGEVARHVQAQV